MILICIDIGIGLSVLEGALEGNDELQQLVHGASLLVGLHPDEATDAIVDVAAALAIPFALVPCCVFPTLFSHRWETMLDME